MGSAVIRVAGVTAATPVVVSTHDPHKLRNADTVEFRDVGGAAGLNGNRCARRDRRCSCCAVKMTHPGTVPRTLSLSFLVGTVEARSFSLLAMDGAAVAGASLVEYTAGGIVTRVKRRRAQTKIIPTGIKQHVVGVCCSAVHIPFCRPYWLSSS